MNILIIGFGVVGKYYFKYLKKNKSIKNIFIYNDFKLPKNSNYKQIDFDLVKIKRNKIKHAIICTPSNLHYKYSKELAKNGINILIEKPFVLQIKHAKELIAINKNNNLKCWVAFQNRCNSAIQKVKKYLTQKKIGNVFLADCSMIWSRSRKYYRVSWRGKYESDGGVLANQAIHLLDAIIYLFGNIKKFNGLIKFNKKKLEAEDLISLNFEHGTKVITSFKATTRADSNYRSSIDIIGEKGRLLVKGISLNTLHILKKKKIFMDKKNSESFGNEAMGSGHQKILKEFLSSNKFKSSYNLEIKNNIHSLKVIHSIYNSIGKNNFIKVNDKQSKLGIK
tara:strand:+ start:1003 stop:2013 length:1011 start_codon:yes stop_codon:yes gene_type:complete